MKLLFVTTRSPFSSYEQDGGAVFASQIISHIGSRTTLDVLFLKENDQPNSNLSHVNAIYYLPPDAGIANRFKRRLSTMGLVKNWISARHEEYDIILVQHVSSGFGIAQLSKLVTEKMIVFPMFTGVSYRRSGEDVPVEYLLEEKKVLQSARLIICPSQSEAQDIVEEYETAQSRIQFAPFGINLEMFKFQPRKLLSKESDLLYVATIKRQKNQLECVSIIETLLQHGISARIHLVGGIGDKHYYSALLKEISLRGLHENIRLHGVLSHHEIANLAAKCTFSISPTNWETFGIAIFESLAMGLPVIAYDDISCFWEYLQPDLACIGVSRSPEVMALRIINFHINPIDYEWRSAQAPAQINHLETRNVMNEIFQYIKIFIHERN